MGSDGEEFHGRTFVSRQAVCPHQVGSRDRYELLHSAVLMHTKYRNLHATVWFSLAASHALTTGEIGIDDADFTRLEARLRRRLNYLYCQFMAHDAWVLEERMLTLEDVVVRTAYADAARTNQGVTRSARRGGALLQLHAAGGQADQKRRQTAQKTPYWDQLNPGYRG